MHELAVTQQILEISRRHAEAAGAARIKSIHLVIGQLSSIVDDSVAFYWDFVSLDTIAEGAQLEFRRIPAKFRCDGCGYAFLMRKGDWYCPRCENQGITLIEGDEFYLDSIDVEMPEEAPGIAPAIETGTKEKM